MSTASPSSSLLNLPGSKPAPKRRLSDASTDSTASKKAKKASSTSEKSSGSKEIARQVAAAAKLSRPKPGEPIDYDKQCGVVNEKGMPCSRSLTCKTHGMGAKRAVTGRSKSYNTLLEEFQKYKEGLIKEKELRAALEPKPPQQPKPPKPAQTGDSATASSSTSTALPSTSAASGSGQASVPSKKGNEAANASGSAPAPKKKKTGEGKAAKGKAAARNKAELVLGEVDDPPENDANAEEEAPDSDDELDQLLQAMRNSKPAPLVMPEYPSFARSPIKVARYRDTFLTAFTGRTMSGAVS